MDVVVVESPAKAKTINKYLGNGFTVLASFGHVRDLPPKDGSVRPDEDFAMDWESEAKSEKRIKEIADAVKGAKRLFLATDPDREGEAISWHVREMLEKRRVLKGVDVKRIVFNEITKSAVLDAVAHPRELDHNLIEAYLARRALDYLVGFNLSPVLWRKLPGSRSAGRVQSVALRLVCEREAEIEVFKNREYWSIDADFRTPGGQTVTARLTHLDGRKLDKFDLPTKEAAEAAVAKIAQASPYKVSSVERKQVRRHPPAPFTTSTLQQEASRKLGFGASHTMRIAQRLYEGVDIGGETVGLITYMRTDSVQLSREAIEAARKQITGDYGRDYLPEHARVYKSTAKNAQEAHEAVRPTNFALRPQDVAQHLDQDQRRLYELVWKRAMASEMESATLDQVAVDIASADGKIAFRANGSVVQFDGFLRLYREDEDDPSETDESERRLPPMNQGEAMGHGETRPEQHFTQPPPRYTEASLVKRMEELGIGRPSTYASILQVLQDRNYVKLEKKRFIPEDRGRLVIAFLASFFERYVEYGFTAALEEKLDDISGDRIAWKTVLREFWQDFSAAIAGTKDLKIRDVLDRLDEDLGPHFFPERADGSNPRACPSCGAGRLGLKLGRHGAFIGCANYPECKFTRPLAVMDGSNPMDGMGDKKELGADPASGKVVTLRQGPYGPYVQLGDADPENKAEKPKRVSIPKQMPPDEITLDRAVALLSLPRLVGKHPETQKDIQAGIGRFGPYLKHDGVFKSIPKDEDVLSIGLNRAVDLLATASKGRQRDPGKELGKHPDGDAPVTLHKGRYGPYVAHGKIYASLPRDMDEASITLDQAVALLAAKAAKGPSKPLRGKKAAKAKPEAAEAAEKPAKAKKAAAAPKAAKPKAAKKKAAKKPETANDAKPAPKRRAVGA
ncbi:MAG: type I DNA topoisomerase [Rhodospirillales bacterium]|nr:type I DNA topoisomerase [Rhodospirillales bacterium]